MTAKKSIKSIAVLCSGGDAPGMNAALRAVVRYGIYAKLHVYGVHKGYSGLLEGNIEELWLRSVANIIQRGGTVIKTDRCKAFHQKAVRAEAVNILRRKKIDALVVIGGEGSFTGGHLMGKENDYPVVGVPGTIDNDVYGSEYTIGFDTAVNTAVEAIDKIRDTASSHDRVFLVEVMGRTSAEIAIRVGVSGGAETIVVPDEIEGNKGIDSLIKSLQRSAALGKNSSIVIVAEGEKPGSVYRMAHELKTRAGIDARVAILGHVQRGGSPSAMDRYMASLMGAEAVKAVLQGKRDLAIGQVNGRIARIAFKSIIGRHKKPDRELLRLAEILAS
ncbi:MAG: 6-phosphofructokinase [Deltaproteobacteria bacterium]|nr:6-phosphofructokinase [Deltaproteobacteria bacterium]